jgi:hypothetical protein
MVSIKNAPIFAYTRREQEKEREREGGKERKGKP